MDAKQFKAALEELGISQHRYARLVKMDVTSVNRWATGKAKHIPELAQAHIDLLLRLHRVHRELLGPEAQSARP